MLLPKKILRLWLFDRVCPALRLGLLLASVDYLMDIIMDYFGTSASKTILNDLAIGILGGAAVYFYLKARCQKCDFESVAEHMNLIVNLNRGIRSALGAVAVSAMSDDRSARLKGVDEASEQIDTILCDLGTARRSRSAKLREWNGQTKPSGPAAAQAVTRGSREPTIKSQSSIA